MRSSVLIPELKKTDWHDLSLFWDWLTDVGEKRMKQKQPYASTRSWSKVGSHILGIYAEMVVALEFGMKLDAVIRPRGDQGRDFVNVAPEFHGRLDAKGVVADRQHWPPILKHPVNDPVRSDWYGLVSVNVEKQRGALIGIVPSDLLATARTHDFGYGDQRMLEASDVRRWYLDYLSTHRTSRKCPYCGTVRLLYGEPHE